MKAFVFTVSLLAVMTTSCSRRYCDRHPDSFWCRDPNSRPRMHYGYFFRYHPHHYHAHHYHSNHHYHHH